jgi:type II secretory pathway pseudopilin PulG
VADRESGFTIIELVMAMAMLAFSAAALAGVFWSAIRTAGVAAHRTDGSSIASREIENMHAVPYAQVGFYADEPGYQATWIDGGTPYSTVTLGPSSPSSGLVPQIEPETPDPQAASGFAPDPNPANATAVVQGGTTYTIARYVVWANAEDASSNYAQAYKRLTVIVSWTDLAGVHVVRQDSLLYPGGLGPYGGPASTVAPTTTTTVLAPPTQPILNPIVQLASPAGETQMSLAWSQPPGGAAVTSYSIEYSTDSSFPAGNITVIAGLAPSILAQTVTNLTPATVYYFEVIAYAGSTSLTSTVQSQSTRALAAPACTLGALNVTGATSLSTTGTILQNSGKMSENLNLSWTTTGNCTDAYTVKATDPSNAADPGSPYSLAGSSGSYGTTVFSSGARGWAIGLHTFTVFDVSTATPTAVVKTFKVCAKGSASC